MQSLRHCPLGPAHSAEPSAFLPLFVLLGETTINAASSGSATLRPLYAIRPGASGDISLRDGESSNQYIAWRQPRAAAYNPSPILLGSQVYVLLDRGTLSSWNALTGAEIYSFQKTDARARAFTTSPWAYDRKIFCLSEDGDTFVIQAGPEMKVLVRNSLDEMCMSSPAIVPNALIIRTTQTLYRIGKTLGR